MRTRLRKIGSSIGVVIPKTILSQIGLGLGDRFELSFNQDRIVLTPIRRHRRAPWVKAAGRIAQSGDDALVWPEFGNDGDADLEW